MSPKGLIYISGKIVTLDSDQVFSPMKVRCTHNSIRMRLRKSDLTYLTQTHSLEESIHFPNGESFRFGLQLLSDQGNIQAISEGGNITIQLPLPAARRWVENQNQVAIEAYLALPEQKRLHILLEKDFPCHQESKASMADTFAELAKRVGHEI